VNRDPSALEDLCREHTPALFPFLLNLTRNEADTRDLLQELFVSLARHPERLDGVREPRAFLFRSAHNLALDHLRSRASRHRAHEAAGQARADLFNLPGNPDDAAHAEALSAAASRGPATVRELAQRAQVGYAAARYTESRMVARGELVRICTGRPALVALPEPADAAPVAVAPAARGCPVLIDWWQQLCASPAAASVACSEGRA
jgi:RNA polymerase sigma factor (sigma-70 family)